MSPSSVMQGSLAFNIQNQLHHIYLSREQHLPLISHSPVTLLTDRSLRPPSYLCRQHLTLASGAVTFHTHITFTSHNAFTYFNPLTSQDSLPFCLIFTMCSNYITECQLSLFPHYKLVHYYVWHQCSSSKRNSSLSLFTTPALHCTVPMFWSYFPLHYQLV